MFLRGTGEAGAVCNRFENTIYVNGLGGNQGDANPSAWLNYVFFDEVEGFDPVNQHDDAGWTLIPSNALGNKQLMTLNIPVIKKPGLLYIYLSYENDSPNLVYFDDFKVTYKKSQVVQNSNYYPFGLQTNESWTRTDTKPNQYLHNSGSELNSSTGWYETPLRPYDPATGRFQGVDILADNYSSLTPYQFANNDPVFFSDPTGAYAIGDEWWNAPRSMWNGRDPSSWARNQQMEAMERASLGYYDLIADDGMYGNSPDRFGAGFIPGEFFGSAKLTTFYDVYEVWTDYYVKENGSPIDSEFKGYNFKESSRRLGNSGDPKNTHTVGKNETLYSLAKKYGTTVAAFKKANGLKSNQINIGQRLKIPGGAKKPTRTKSNSDIVSQVLNQKINYSYRAEGATKTMKLADTPYGKYLLDRWNNHYKEINDIHFLNVIPGNTNIMLSIDVFQWRKLDWGIRAMWYDVGVEGLKKLNEM